MNRFPVRSPRSSVKSVISTANKVRRRLALPLPLFRLLSREALTGLYASIKRSYTSGRGGRYTVSQED